MNITLLPFDVMVEFDQFGQPTVHGGFSILCLLPNEAMVEAIQALPQPDVEGGSWSSDAAALNDVLPPNTCLAILTGDEPDEEPLSTRCVLARDLRTMRQEASRDSSWWDRIGVRNRAVLAYIEELPDSTKVMILST